MIANQRRIKLHKAQFMIEYPMKIPNHSCFEGINFYFTQKYALPLLDGIDAFQEGLR